MSNGYAVELKAKFDWNEDSVLVFTTHGCTVIQQGKVEEGEVPFFILLKFNGTKCVRGASTDCSPDFGIHPETRGASSISVLTDTEWDEDAHNEYTYIGTPKDTVRKHYVVSNHDVFHEILAESFTETKVTHGDPNFESIKSFYLFSNAQIV